MHIMQVTGEKGHSTVVLARRPQEQFARLFVQSRAETRPFRLLELVAITLTNGYNKSSENKETNPATDGRQLGHRQMVVLNSRPAYLVAPKRCYAARSGVNEIVLPRSRVRTSSSSESFQSAWRHAPCKLQSHSPKRKIVNYLIRTGP